MPRHTFEELMALSSKYTRLDPPGIKTSEDLPSVTVIVDCIKVGDPFGTAETALLNAFLASAFAEPVRVPSIRVLISSDYYPRSKPDLYGSETGKIRLFTLSDSVKNHFATPAFLDISSNYVYLLQCPSPNQSLSTHLFSGPTHISDLIQIAGTAEYEDKALSTAGIARVQSGMQGPVVMAYGPYQKPDEDEREKAAYRQLRESRPIEIPLGELLIASSWLSALIVDSADRDTATSDGFPYGLTASMGQMLASQLHIKSWAVPLDPRFSIDALPTGLLDVARKLPEAFGWPDQTELNTKLMGSSAKIAVLITSADEAYATVWETIICSFAKDTTYSHEIRLFAGFDARDSQVYIMNCPGVEVHPLQKDALETWSPDICLMSSESRLDIRSMHLPYFELDVPRAELRHLEWLAALPLESLLSK